MKKLWKGLLAALLVVALAAGVFAALAATVGDMRSGDRAVVDPDPTPAPKPPSPTPKPRPNPKSVTLDRSGTVKLKVGGTLQLKASVKPSNARNKGKLTWTSSNAKVATVSGGVVIPLKAGSATITVKTWNGRTASVKVSVHYEGKDGGLKGYMDSKGVLTISGKGALESMDTILEEAHINKKDVRKIVIKKGVTGIGDFCFASFPNVRSVTIAGSVRRIGASAFAGCKRLKEVVISEGVKRIGDEAFADCVALESLTIPRSVTKIGVPDEDGLDGNYKWSSFPRPWEYIIIRAHKGSYAQRWAKKYGLLFAGMA